MSGVVTLADLRDRARPLLIFAPSPSDPQLQIQLRTMADHAPAAAERDMVVLALPYRGASSTSPTLAQAEADSVRRKFHVQPSDFVVVLLGKDGGEKLRSAKPLRFDKLQAVIDAMPMRQEEMRKPNGIPR